MRVCVWPLTSPSAAPSTGTSTERFSRRAAAEAGTALIVFETSIWPYSVATDAFAGMSGRKTAAKKLSLTPAQSNGPFSVSPPEIFFGARCSSLPLRMVSNCACAYAFCRILVAEAARPAQQRAQRNAVARHLHIRVQHIALIERERLANLKRPIRILEGQ